MNGKESLTTKILCFLDQNCTPLPSDEDEDEDEAQ